MKYFNLIEATSFTPVYDTFGTPSTGVTNSENDPFIPETWANESIAILVENLVAANLVHRDFENLIARFGDVINTRKPAEFTANRKTDYEDVTIQTPEATNVQVKLDQHYHVSFMIKDGEDTVSFKDLVAEYLEPAVIAIAQAVDKVILGQHAQFFANANVAGKLGLLASGTAKDYILDTRKVMNDNKCPVTGRRFVVGSDSETSILKADDFTSAEKVGDNGTALREASIGFKLGFDFFMDQNMSEYTNTDTGTADDINNGNITAGSTIITMTDSSVVTVGDMITIAGDMTPQRVTAVNGTTHAVTITPGLRYDIADAASVTVYDSGAIDQGTSSYAEGGTPSASGYRVGWHKAIMIDGLASNPDTNVGQQIYIAGTIGYTYTIVSVDSSVAASSQSEVQLDRPLEEAVADGAVVSLYPTGNYNFAFHRNAIAFVTRPLAMPRQGTGALAAVVNYEGIGLRVCITYDGTRQGHLVTVDLLCGVKVLDTQYGAVMYG